VNNDPSSFSEKQVFTRIPLWGFFFFSFFILVIGNPLFKILDTRLRDFWFSVRLKAASPAENPFWGKFSSFFPPLPSGKEIVVVLADDRSVLGIPPLFRGDRRVYAQTLKNISEGRPKVIAFDVFFPTVTAQDEEQDTILAETVKKLGNVVLKSFRRGDEQITPPFPALALAGSVAPSYFRAHVDEAVRKASALFRPALKEPILSFQAETARIFWGIPIEKVNFGETELVFKLPSGPYSIPLHDGEFVFVNYNVFPRSFQTLSLIDVYNKTVDPTVFTDKIVILGIGNSMSEDRLFTPFGTPEFTPFIHAVIIDNFISRSLIAGGNEWLAPSLGLCLLIICIFLVAPSLEPLIFGSLVFLGVILLLGISFFALSACRMFDVTPSIFSLVATLVFSIGFRYYSELSEKLRIKNAFQHYVTASVVNEILRDPSKLKLHGEERQLTIFFSDIEGFTSLSEGMSPLMVVSILNEYLTSMTEIIFAYGGLLDKYEGDAIMSVFGAPVDQTDHPIRACLCALEHQKTLAKLREKWLKEGKPPIYVRIGINTGMVVVGNMGSKMRFDYTVIGDNVNLAARLESANKLFHTEILTSGDTAELVQSRVLTRFLGILKVVGRKQTVPVYEVLADLQDPDFSNIEKMKTAKKVYEEALSLALRRKFREAVDELSGYLEKRSDDRPAVLLKKRCENYLAAPPPPDWDGIMIQDQK